MGGDISVISEYGIGSSFTITMIQKVYKENDIITLTVRKTAKSDVAFKESAVGNIISIVPTDTNSLATGLYVYDVQLTTE